MKLKDGRTYVTRSGVKRKVRQKKENFFYPFEGKSITWGSSIPDICTETGRYIDGGKKHKWDLVREVKKNAK